MYRFGFLLFTICFILFFKGCIEVQQKGNLENYDNVSNGNDSIQGMTPPQKINVFFGLSDQDFVIADEDTNIELNDKYEYLVTIETLIDKKNVDEKRVYCTYVYANFIVSVSPINDSIFYINLLTPQYKTARGIAIGDSIEDVEEKYGSSVIKSENSISYNHNAKFITFWFDGDNEVTRIVLEML